MEVQLTEDFKNDVSKLIKKYKSIKDDINTLILELENIPNKWIDLWNWFYKIRLKNSDNNKWKSWWYRTITYYNNWNKVILVTIYSKTEKENISIKNISKILNKYLYK